MSILARFHPFNTALKVCAARVDDAGNTLIVIRAPKARDVTAWANGPRNGSIDSAAALPVLAVHRLTLLC